MEERRKIEQEPIYDENGNLEYIKIPNYRVHKPFLSQNEIIFFRTLNEARIALNKSHNLQLSIFSQVALNRIIDVNNERFKYKGSNEKNQDKGLWDEIHERSIDFVLYDNQKNEIYCCIELNDETHNQPKRIERDAILLKILKGNIEIIFQKRQNCYKTEEIIKKILDCKREEINV